MRILYLTFFESVTGNGIYESQVKQTLCKLATQYSDDLAISHLALQPAVVVGRSELLMSFVTDRQAVAILKNEYKECGISASVAYLPVVILKRWKMGLPLIGLAVALATSLPVLLYKTVRWRPDIIHCRSYVATLLAVLMKYFFKDVRVIFDPRGFWPEEGVVTCLWSETSLNFGFWKRVEKYLLRRCDKVIALSDSFAARIGQLEKGADSAVIYASANLQEFERARQFRDLKKRDLGLEGKTVFVYNGGLGAWHDPSLLAQVFKTASQALSDTKLLAITGYNRGKLESAFRSAGLRTEDFLVIAAKPQQVPGYLVTGDYGIVPLKEINEPGAMTVVADTMIGTKVAEYLACGLPIVVNKNVGGLKSLMEQYKIGVFFDSENLAELLPALRHVHESYAQYRTDCELVASRFFSLDQTANSYYQVYRRILASSKIGNGELETAKV
jgi:glycosyltransferase involved in cell wall biosynthesis